MQFIPGTTPLVFPEGTTIEHHEKTWAMYVNKRLYMTWIGYAVPGGTRLMRLPGIRSKLSTDFGNIKTFVQQKQAVECRACGD